MNHSDKPQHAAALFNWQPPRIHGLFGHFGSVKKHCSCLVVRFFLFAMGLCFWSFPALAQNRFPAPIEITSQFNERKIGWDVAFLEDASGKLTFEQVRSPEMAAQFKLSTKDSPSFGYTKSAYWARFVLNDKRPIKNANDQNALYLKLAYAQTDLAELLCLDAEGAKVVHQHAGDHVPRSNWPTSYREPVFTIPVSAQTCWLRVQSTASIQFPITLYSEQAYVDMRLSDNALQALYFGALLVMLIYNGVIAASTRSIAYTSYSVFLMIFGLGQLAIGGFGYALFWPNAIGFADAILPFLISCAGIISAFFTSALFDLRKTAPIWFKLNLGLTFLLGATLVLPWLLPYALSIKIVFSLAPAWAFVLIGSGIYLATCGVRIAKIFLAAWLVFVLGILINMAVILSWVPSNVFTANAPQIGSAIEFIMLSFALADRIKTTQVNLLNAQKKIAEGLRLSEQELTEKVQQRTAELETANSQILSAYNTADALRVKAEAAKEEAEIAKNLAETQRQQAEIARHETAQALADLKATQNQLIAAEKMASLGLLVSNVAHEINTPIGAVKSSGALIADTLESTLAEMPKLFSLLEDAPRGLFIQLVLGNKGANPPMSTREERALTKQIAAQLEDAGVDDVNRKARLLMKLRAHQNPLDYLPLLQHPESDFILQVASNIADVVNSTHNINNAVERVSRVVYALKALSGDDVLRAVILAPLQPGMDKALAKYASQMQNVELIQHYQADMPAIRADHDAVEQLCIHLVMNALQAMNYEGKLTVGLRAENNHAIITVADTGSGIADDIKARIFEPFFTTRLSGEGSGMGLAIVKRIVEQHRGTIDVQTEVGMGTTLTVTLPYQLS
jgi:signal transduction histidine kinase